jgi:hypothetical protein
MGPFAIRQVTGKPYFLETETEQSQTLADGTHISRQTQKNREYRDSQGRTRTEHEPMIPGHPARTFRLIQTADPVARFRYTQDSQDRIAHRVRVTVLPDVPRPAHTLGTFRTRPVANAPNPSDPPHREVQQEPLGTQTFEGLLAEGVRTTITLPVGWDGNDRPIETVCEYWTSTDLNMVVMSKCSDPRTGENTTRLTHAELSDPDPLLFRVPDGYKIQKEKTPKVRPPITAVPATP